MTTQTAPGMPPPQLLAAMTAFRNGRYADALEMAEKALDGADDRAPFVSLASMAAQRQGKPERAIPHLRELLAQHPSDPAILGNLAKALVATGELDEAQSVALKADTPALLRIRGFLAQQRGDLATARTAYETVLAREADDAASLNNLANILAQLGDVDEAVATFERAITAAPREVQIYLNLADVLRGADRGQARLRVMEDAAKVSPHDRNVLTELAMAHAHADNPDRAIAILEDVVRQFPAFGESHIELGRLYESLNRIDDLATLVATLGPGPLPAEAGFLGAWLAYREGRFDDAAEMAAAIPDTIHPMRRFHLVGSIEERRGNSVAAFAAFERMNQEAVADAPVATPGPTYREALDAARNSWNADWMKTWPADPPQAGMPADPIFLVGFPRSGTTLLDTMLMGLDGLSVLEERPMIATLERRLGTRDIASLSGEDIVALRKDYFALARDHGWKNDRLLVDKHPLHMARVPFIRRLFPEARFILIERHPYDVALSCFIANFQLNFAMRSFTSLRETALTYDAAFSAWEQARSLLDIQARTVRYERLVVDPANELEPLAEWLGLAWKDEALDHTRTARERGRVSTASYAQIGEPLYQRARFRWKRYEAQIAPITPILAPWVEKLGYETT